VKRSIHFVGIGGAGMSALAHILLDQGQAVTGSDLALNAGTERLSSRGAKIYRGHGAGNVQPETMLVVRSSAIPATNPELQAARDLSLPILTRGEMLARIGAEQQVIAVAGAHGKTTTTAMIATVFIQNGLDPTVLVGGDIPLLNGNARSGRSGLLVTEADESDGSFLLLQPYCSVVTNVEPDHLDHYGSIAELEKAYIEFLGKTPELGFSVVCGDDPVLRDVVSQLPQRCYTYGVGAGNDFRMEVERLAGYQAQANVYFREAFLGKLRLGVPGQHNLLNALAAIAVAAEFGIGFQEAGRALATYQGAKRRFEVLGNCRGAIIIDDYAHHPTEVKATLRAAMNLGAKRVLAVFQPHRFSRTSRMYREFGEAFGDADAVVITDVYAAGESPIPGVSGRLIFDQLPATRPGNVYYMPEKTELVAFLRGWLLPGDALIIMGAGDIWKIAEEIMSI